MVVLPKKWTEKLIFRPKNRFFSKNVGQIYFFVLLLTYYTKARLFFVLFYDVEFLTIPKIKYNCAVIAPKYRATVSKNDNLFELCYLEAGECICQTKSGALICETGHLYPMIFREKTEIYSESDSPVKMLSVGLDCSFSLSIVDSEKLSEADTRILMKNLLSGSRFLIPVEGISSLASDWIQSYIKKIVSCKVGERIGEETRALSLFIDFMSRITASSMDSLAYDAKAFPTSSVAYSEMVISYIIKNYRKKITVADIAKVFDLTPNYLHAIFKQVKGTTIVDYLTTYRMTIAKTYIERFGLHAYEAAELVGIDDPAYFSRIFKKLYGKSISELKREQN